MDGLCLAYLQWDLYPLNRYFPHCSDYCHTRIAAHRPTQDLVSAPTVRQTTASRHRRHTLRTLPDLDEIAMFLDAANCRERRVRIQPVLGSINISQGCTRWSFGTFTTRALFNCAAGPICLGVLESNIFWQHLLRVQHNIKQIEVERAGTQTLGVTIILAMLSFGKQPKMWLSIEHVLMDIASFVFAQSGLATTTIRLMSRHCVTEPDGTQVLGPN